MQRQIYTDTKHGQASRNSTFLVMKTVRVLLPYLPFPTFYETFSIGQACFIDIAFCQKFLYCACAWHLTTLTPYASSKARLEHGAINPKNIAIF